MKRFPLFCVAALLGVAVSAPAQRITIDGAIGRHLVGSVTVSARDHDHREHGRRDRPRRHVEPVRRPAPRLRGHWRTIEEQVLVPGFWHEQHVPPTYGWITDRCGRRHWGIVDPGGCRRVWVPARWETRTRRIWVSC